MIPFYFNLTRWQAVFHERLMVYFFHVCHREFAGAFDSTGLVNCITVASGSFGVVRGLAGRGGRFGCVGGSLVVVSWGAAVLPLSSLPALGARPLLPSRLSLLSLSLSFLLALSLSLLFFFSPSSRSRSRGLWPRPPPPVPLALGGSGSVPSRGFRCNGPHLWKNGNKQTIHCVDQILLN